LWQALRHITSLNGARIIDEIRFGSPTSSGFFISHFCSASLAA
jgi:hypothetical protein